ncbi:acyltransferase family protein [Enterococcus dongliensis]|uniref:acyltransferase family protein n=1 Tax=Enterococcus dongliensis TaxID=2559925 RepID=UPI0028923D57|nr:acyltransferase family protein [Enterococcus dongliensis]MDT2612988.1 acyltransferase family protein [Enterococcus dongliensis]
MGNRLKHSRYITGFDGIRSLAVIGVILYHLMPTQMRGGYLGVAVFFVVSGYLITDLLLQEWNQTGRIDIKQFYYRRMKRLYPALVTMLIGASAYITLFQRNLLNNLRGNVISSLLYVNNWWQINHGMSYFDRFSGESPFTHIWSLAVETQNYLLWPIVFVLLIKLVKNKGKIFLGIVGAALFSAILMAVLYVPGQDPTRVYYGTDTRLFSILLGGALAFIWPSTRLKGQIPLQAKRILNGIGLGALLLLLVSLLFLRNDLSFVYYGGIFLVSLLSVLLVAITAHPGASLNRWLTNPVFDWIGKRSYGIYLYQFPVMIFYEAKINVANHTWLHTMMEIILILFVTELSYRYAERPLRIFDYRKTFATLKTSFWAPIKSRRKIGFIFSSLITLIALIGVIIAPTNKADADQQALQQQIEQNKQAAEKKTTDSQSAETDQSGQTTESSQKPLSIGDKYNLNNREVTKAKKMKVTAFGDSVLLAGSKGLTEIFPKMTVDGEVGRQLSDSPALLQTLKDKDELNETILLSLGTNGPFSQDDFAQIMNVLGSKRQVFVINTHVPTRRWQNDVNANLAAAAKQYKNVHLIDWYDFSNNHIDWFYDDQVHPNDAGSIQYCHLIAKELLKGQ